MSLEEHLLAAPATPQQIAAAESTLGRRIPLELRRLYEFSNGAELMHGNLIVNQIDALSSHGDQLREWGWPIPHELLVFGGNGAGDLFGVWYPPAANADAESAVALVGEVFEPRCLAILGTSLGRFARAWSAYYLQLTDAPAEALDALQLPEGMRSDELDTTGPFFAWADPALPDTDPDPYERGLTAEEFHQWFVTRPD